MTETLLGVAHKELIQVPKYALDAMATTARSTLQLMLPSIQPVQTLYEEAKPTARRVLKLIKSNPTNRNENQALGYLRQYIRGTLKKFLRHYTGAETICFGELAVVFNTMKKGAGRYPIAHNCGPTLVLPATQAAGDDSHSFICAGRN